MTAISRVGAIHLAVESTYGTDPSAGGSGYTFLPSYGRPIAKNAMELGVTAFAQGRNSESARVPLVSGGSIDLEIPWHGIITSGGDGVSTTAKAAIDWLLDNALGQAQYDLAGEGVAGASTVSNLILDATVTNLGANHLCPVWRTADGRVMWRAVNSAAGAPTYTITPDWPTAPLTADVLMATRQWNDTGETRTQGATLAMCCELDGTIQRLLGGRVKSLMIDAQAGKEIKAKLGLDFDSYAFDAAKTALPAVTIAQPAAPKLSYSSVVWGTTEYAVNSVSISFGIKSAPLPSALGANGRSDWQILSVEPEITIDPVMTTGLTTDFEAGTTRACLVQLGGGTSTGFVNSSCLYMPYGQVILCEEKDSGGYLRTQIKIKAMDALGGKFWSFARC